MSLKEKIFLLSFLIFISSCDYGNEPKDFGRTIQKIYTFNLSDSSLHEISDGHRPITLFQSNKLVFVIEKNFSSKVWLYDFSTKGKEILANDLHPPLFDDSVVSPDEKHLVFIKYNKLKLLDLNSGEIQIIDSSSNPNLQFPKFSNDGRFIVYLTYPNSKNDLTNLDSVYLNLYSFSLNKSSTIDTVFIRENDVLNAKFTNDSKKVYMQRDGWHPTNFKWQMEFTIYSLDPTPKIFRKRTIYPFDYRRNSWNIDEDKILILDKVGLYTYDINSDIITKPIKLDASLNVLEARKVKNLDYLIGSDEDNTIHLINLKGETRYKIKPKIEGQIYWADYYTKFNSILFASSHWIP